MRLILNVPGIVDVDINHGGRAEAVVLGEVTMGAFVDGHAVRMKQKAATSRRPEAVLDR